MTLAERRRSTAVVAVAVLLAVAGALRMSLPVDAEVLAFLPAGEPEVAAFDELATKLHARDVVLVGVGSDDLFTNARLGYLRAVSDVLLARPEVAHVTGLATLAVIETKEGEAAHVSLIPPVIPTDPAALAALRARVLAQDYLANVVSADAGATLMIVQLAPAREALSRAEQAENVRAAVAGVPAPPGVSLHFAGAPFVEAASGALADADLGMLGPGMGIALLTLIALVMRSFRGTVIVIKTTLLATVIALGVLGWAGARASLVATSLPLVVLLFACAASIAVVLGASPLRVVLRAAVAAAAACLAWLLMDSAPLRQLGVMLAIALVVAAAVVIAVGPALLALWPVRAPAPTPAPAPAPVFLAVLLAAGLATQVPRLTPQADIHRDFPARSAAAEADRFQVERFGGYLYLQVLVNGDLADPQALARIAAFEDLLWSVPGVVRVQSLTQVLAVVRESLSGSRRLPDTEKEVRQLHFLARTNDPATRLLVDDDAKTTAIQIAIAGASEAVEQQIQRLAERLARGEAPGLAARLLALAGQRADVSEHELMLPLNEALAAPSGGAELEAAKRAVAAVLAKEIGEEEMIALRDEGALARLQTAVAELGPRLTADSFAAALRREAAPDELDDAASFAKVSRYLYAGVDDALVPALTDALDARLAPLLVRDQSGDPRMRSLRDRRIAETLEEVLRPPPAAAQAAAIPLSVRVTGEPMLMRALGRTLADDLGRGLAVGLGLAALVLLASASFAERSPRVVLALVPVAAALLGMAGMMGLAGYPLDLTTPVAIAVALALGLLAGAAALVSAPAIRMLVPAGALFVLAFAAFGPVHRLGVLAVVAAALAAFAAILVQPRHLPRPPTRPEPRPS